MLLAGYRVRVPQSSPLNIYRKEFSMATKKGGAKKKAASKKTSSKKTASKKTENKKKAAPKKDAAAKAQRSKDTATQKQLLDRALAIMDKGDYDPIRRTQAVAFLEAFSDAVQEALEEFKAVPLFKAGGLVKLVPVLRPKRKVRIPFTDPVEHKMAPSDVVVKATVMKNAKDSVPSVQKARKRLS
jgi:hypothetical protein